jgi:hypothetical protein
MINKNNIIFYVKQLKEYESLKNGYEEELKSLIENSKRFPLPIESISKRKSEVILELKKLIDDITKLSILISDFESDSDVLTIKNVRGENF